MKVSQVMTPNVVKISPEESVSVAARALAHYNIGALPVCGEDGRLCGVVTDRDLVTRCVASNRKPEQTKIREVMTGHVLSVRPDMDTSAAAHLMGRKQIRRLPVVDGGKLCGMISLGDLAKVEQTSYDAGDALAQISDNLSVRDERLLEEPNKNK